MTEREKILQLFWIPVSNGDNAFGTGFLFSQIGKRINTLYKKMKFLKIKLAIIHSFVLKF